MAIIHLPSPAFCLCRCAKKWTRSYRSGLEFSRMYNSGRVQRRPKDSRRRSPQKPPARKTVEIFTQNFEYFHGQCQAARYKVHRPRCQCSGIVKLFSNELKGAKEDGGVDDAPTVNEWFPEQLADGLKILPDTRSKHWVFFCDGTSNDTYDKSPMDTELKLKDIISPPLPSGGSLRPYKISCAACLLEIEPNGFACVSSVNRSVVDSVRDDARALAEKKVEFHHDHADFVATIPRSSLMKLHQSKTRNQSREANDEVVQLLISQGVPIQPDADKIRLQHHLTALLVITQEYRSSNTTNGEASLEDDPYWLIMGYNDTKNTNRPCWSLDLGGGKRDLGETALQAAIRETEEEMSFIWDPRWIRQELCSTNGTVNKYYLISPPGQDEGE